MAVTERRPEEAVTKACKQGGRRGGYGKTRESETAAKSETQGDTQIPHA